MMVAVVGAWGSNAQGKPRKITAVVDDTPPVVWNGAIGDGFALIVGDDDRFVATTRSLRLVGHRSIDVTRAQGGMELIVRGIVDVLDENGAPIARDRAIETWIGE